MSKGRKEGVTTKEITVLRFHGEMNASCEPGPRNGDGKGETRRLNLSSRAVTLLVGNLENPSLSR